MIVKYLYFSAVAAGSAHNMREICKNRFIYARYAKYMQNVIFFIAVTL